MRLVCALCLALTLAAVSGAALAAEPAGDLRHATQALAAGIHAQRWAQGIPDQAKPSQPLGSTKTVLFKMRMKQGKGRNSASAYCFGYTLDCVARVKGPANRYSGKVTTSEGSVVRFTDKKEGQPLDMTLKTGFLGDTRFTVVMEAGNKPYPREALVELVCSY